MSVDQRRKAYQTGVMAEEEAALALQAKGYDILERRYKTRYGEIDLLAEKDGVLVAVEVKARQSEVAALESVLPRARKRIENSLLYYVGQNPGYQNHDFRFDVVVIVPPFTLKHLENAWQPEV